jgi:hypothetical protein
MVFEEPAYRLRNGPLCRFNTVVPGALSLAPLVELSDQRGEPAVG